MLAQLDGYRVGWFLEYGRWNEGVIRSLAIVFFQAEDGIRDHCVTGVQTCALPIFRLAMERPPAGGRAGQVPAADRSRGRLPKVPSGIPRLEALRPLQQAYQRPHE